MPENSPEHLFTIMCEDVRPEALGKMSVLGLYLDNIYFKDRILQMRSLGFLTRLRGVKGKFLVTFKISGPSTTVVKDAKIKEARFPSSKESEISSLVVQFANIQFQEEGLHHYEVFLDDISSPIARFSFRVSVRPEMFK